MENRGFLASRRAGHDLGRSTIQRFLEERGIEPAPLRERQCRGKPSSGRTGCAVDDASRSRPSTVSAAIIAAPLSVRSARGRAALVKGLREAVDEGLGGLVEVPLQVAAKPRAVVENAEQLRLLPLSAGGQDGTRALVKVQTPEAVHNVRDLVRARLARRERLAVEVFPMAPFAGAQETLLLHEAAHRCVAGTGPLRGSSRASATRLSR
jgi:hypothetical protein